MRHLVPHHAGKLRFIVGGGNGSGINEHGSARQSERIDAGIEDHGEGKRPARGLRLRRQPLAHALHVILQKLVLDHGDFLANLGGGLLAELNVLLLGEQIEAGPERVAGLPRQAQRDREARRQQQVHESFLPHQ